MCSRGAVAKYGYTTTDDYETVAITESGVKILVGKNGKHSLPEISNTPNSIYAKMKDDGVTLHEMRFFGDDCMPTIELAYHPEPNLNNGDRQEDIVHFHLFDGLKRLDAVRISDCIEIKEQYEKYLKEFNLYDKC